jgi:hypothetical protein
MRSCVSKILWLILLLFFPLVFFAAKFFTFGEATATEVFNAWKETYKQL